MIFSQIEKRHACELFLAIEELQEEIASIPTGPTGPTGPSFSSTTTTGLVQLVSGQAVVVAPACTPASNIVLSYLQPVTNGGILSVSGIATGQFTILSSNGADASYVQWLLAQYPGDSLTIPGVTTNSLTTPVAERFAATGNVVSNGYQSITERGFVWSKTNPSPTISDTKETASLGYGLGNYTGTWYDGTTTLTYVRAFATNDSGTAYGNVLTGQTFICLARGTRITLADGSVKAIEDVRYTDELLVWDFDRGTLATASPLWIKKREITPRYNVLRFSNGVELRTIDQHRIFNEEKGMFTYPMTDETPPGTHSFSHTDGRIMLVGKTVMDEPIDYYNIITFHHMNLFADGILTSCRYNNLYPIREMRFVKEVVHRTREMPAIGFDRIYYDGLRLDEQILPWETTREYVDRLERTRQKTILFLDHQGVLYLHPDHRKPDAFDPACVRALNDLLEKTPHLEIVVSSDWRTWVDLETMRRFYRDQGVRRPPLDYTPVLEKRHGVFQNHSQHRAEEIRAWLEAHRDEVNDWIAIDDLDMSPYLSDHFIRTETTMGLVSFPSHRLFAT